MPCFTFLLRMCTAPCICDSDVVYSHNGIQTVKRIVIITISLNLTVLCCYRHILTILFIHLFIFNFGLCSISILYFELKHTFNCVIMLRLILFIESDTLFLFNRVPIFIILSLRIGVLKCHLDVTNFTQTKPT